MTLPGWVLEIEARAKAEIADKHLRGSMTVSADYKFMDHALEDIPRLVDEVRRLRAELEEVDWPDGDVSSLP